MKSLISGAVAFAIGFILSFLIWFFSKQLFGHIEPWDGHGPLSYFPTLMFIGFLTGLIDKDFFIGPIGIYIGQFSAIAFSVILANEDWNLFPLTLIGLAIFLIPALITNAIGVWIRISIEKKFLNKN